MLRKEDVYINLQGKSKEELTELYNFLKNIGEIVYRDLENFLQYSEEGKSYLSTDKKDWCCAYSISNKTEVTIEQLKEILQPMEKFTPIAMKCTQEQFEAIKPKLKDLDISAVYNFKNYNYLINYYGSQKNKIGTVRKTSVSYEVKVYEEWNEEIFLKACGIEVELSLTEQLEKAKAEVERLEKAIEESKIKVGDWVKNTHNNIFKYQDWMTFSSTWIKITNPQLIELLENELIK